MFGNGNDDGDDGEEGNSRIATVVGNAAVSGDQFQQRCLADAICPDYGSAFAVTDSESDVLEEFVAARQAPSEMAYGDCPHG